MVFEFTGKLIDPIFAPLLVFDPYLSIFLFSVFISAVIFGINKLMINKKVAKEIKEKLTNIRENLTKAQKEGKKDEINKFLNEYMKTNNEYMQQMFKVMIVSLVVVIVFFPWGSYRFGDAVVVTHPVVQALNSLPLISLLPNWVVWYALVSVAVSWTLRKFLGE
ncbi:MAG: DUF106 domain-containing protein [Candidatus Aenigmarchaeota archaeon]|nr:DUF106 domain-containing protein [Candidatus Aenigmarchaeota archaeon]